MLIKRNTGLYIISRQLLERHSGKISPHKVYYTQDDGTCVVRILDNEGDPFWIHSDHCKFIKMTRERPLP